MEPYKIRQNILLFASPFCPSKLLYTEIKEQAGTVSNKMKALEDEGLGHIFIYGNNNIFSNGVPSKVEKEKLRVTTPTNFILKSSSLSQTVK